MKNPFNLIAVAGLSLLCLGACQTKQNKDNAQADTVRVENVKVTPIYRQTIERNIDVSSNLQGYETQNIAPSLQGRIEHIYTEVGKRVKKGDNLVRMDQNQYRTTKLTFQNLSTELKRMEALRESGSVSQQAYDQTKLGYDQTRESLEFLETNTYVKAPFEGVISAKNYEDGELYAGQPILVLTQINKLKTNIAIPENYFPKIKQGMSVDLRSDIYPDEVFKAKVEIVYPTIDAATHTFQVKLQIPNKDERLRPGMYVRSTISIGKERTMVVPYQAVLKLAGANDRFVFLNENGVAKRVTVQLGQRFNDQVEIISSEIYEGAQLVTTGQGRLIDGVQLNVVE